MQENNPEGTNRPNASANDPPHKGAPQDTPDASVDKVNLWAADIVLRENRAKLLALKAIEQGHNSEIALMAVLDWTQIETQNTVGALEKSQLITVARGITSRPVLATYTLNYKKSGKFFSEMGALGIFLTEAETAGIGLSKDRTVEEINALRAKRLLLLEQELFPAHLAILDEAIEDPGFAINDVERTAADDFFGKLRSAVYGALDFEDGEKALLIRMVHEHFIDLPKRWPDLELFMAINLLYDGLKILRFWNSSGGPEAKRMWTINSRGELIEFPRAEFFSRIQDLHYGNLYQRKEYVAKLTSLLSPGAWLSLQTVLSRLPDYILSYRQYKTFRYLQSLFCEQTTVRLDGAREEIIITQPLRFLTTGGFKTKGWSDPDWVLANYDERYAQDFKTNCYEYLDDFLDLLVDAKVSPSRKKAFIWLLAKSDSWKGAFFGGVLEERLRIALSFTIRGFHALLEGGRNAGYTAADFFGHWIVTLDDCKDLGEIVKLADEYYKFVPKYGFNTTVPSFTKIVLNAKLDDQPLLSGGAIDEQLAQSRVSKHDMLENTTRFVDHPLYLKSPITYLDNLGYYCILRINERLGMYKSLDPTAAGDAAFAEISMFHNKYKLAHSVIPIAVTLKEKSTLLRELLADYFNAFDDEGRPYAGRPFNQAPTALKGAIAAHVKLARLQPDGTRRLERVLNQRGTPISLQPDDWIVLKSDGARSIAAEYFRGQQNSGVLMSNMTDMIRAMHDDSLCRFPLQGGLALLNSKIYGGAIARGIAFFAIPRVQADVPDDAPDEDQDGIKQPVGEVNPIDDDN